MKSNTVFSISEGMIKFLQVSDTPKKLVTAVGVISIENQNDGQISQTISVFIKNQKLNLAESRVTILIPRSRVILRHMIFPSHKQEEIQSMIDLQIGSHIPYAKEEVDVDFQILTKSADGYAKVAIVIIPQETAMRYWKIFSDAKVPVQRITISSIGLWLLYRQQPDFTGKPGAIFDLDVNHSEICLCTESHWLASREIPIGLKQMHQEGYAEILKQWKLTQENTGSEKSAVPLESIYLISAPNQANLLGTELLKAQNDLTVKEIHLTQLLATAPGVKWPKIMTDDGISAASLAGIAFSPETPPINLIPKAVRQTQEKRTYQRQLVILGLWVTAALVSLGLAAGMGFFQKNIQLARLKDRLHDSKRDAAQVEGQLKKIHDLEDVINNRLVFSDLAHEIYRLLPTQIYLVSITINDWNTLSLQGVSSTPVDINQFQKGMVDSQKFSNVSLDYVNKRVTQQGEVDYFKITCTLKSVNGQK